MPDKGTKKRFLIHLYFVVQYIKDGEKPGRDFWDFSVSKKVIGSLLKNKENYENAFSLLTKTKNCGIPDPGTP